MRRHLPMLLLLPFVAACASDRLFAPRENANGVGPTGRPAAVYVLPAPARGEVRVWSDGGERREDGGAATRLKLGFEVENTGTEPLELDPAAVRVTEVVVEDAPAGAAAPAATLQGPPARLVAQPGTTARADLEFAVEGEVVPRSITGFAVHWSVAGGGGSYAQITPFQTYYPDVDDRYDPWPWWGFGFGWHWHRR